MDLQPKYIQNPLNLIRKTGQFSQMGKRFEKTFHKRKNTDGK